MASPDKGLVQVAGKSGLELPLEFEDSVTQAAVGTITSDGHELIYDARSTGQWFTK